MSEKKQHTAADLRAKMLHRYDDGLDHKHNKNHLPYRQHCKTHPSNPQKSYLNGDSETHQPTGFLRLHKLKRTKTRINKGKFH